MDGIMVTLSFRPQSAFSSSPGQEQFFIEKEGTVAHRQVLFPPGRGRRFPVLPVAIGLVVVGVIAAVAAVFALGSTGGDGAPVAVVIPTETPVPTEAPIPTETPVPTEAPRPVIAPTTDTIILTPPPTRPMPTPGPTYTPMPTYTPFPTATPRPTYTPPPTPTARVIVVTPTATSTPSGTHKVPAASVTVEPTSAAPGDTITISGVGFPAYVSISAMTIATVSTRPTPAPATDSDGVFKTTALVPQLDTGSHALLVTAGGTTATSNFTVVKAAVR